MSRSSAAGHIDKYSFLKVRRALAVQELYSCTVSSIELRVDPILFIFGQKRDLNSLAAVDVLKDGCKLYNQVNPQSLLGLFVNAHGGIGQVDVVVLIEFFEGIFPYFL